MINTRPMFADASRHDIDVALMPMDGSVELQVASRGHVVLAQEVIHLKRASPAESSDRLIVCSGEIGSGMTSLSNWLTRPGDGAWLHVDLALPFGCVGPISPYEEARLRTVISARSAGLEVDGSGRITSVLGSIDPTIPGIVISVGSSLPRDVAKTIWSELRAHVERGHQHPRIVVVVDRVLDVFKSPLSNVSEIATIARRAPLSVDQIAAMLADSRQDAQAVAKQAESKLGGIPLLGALLAAALKKNAAASAKDVVYSTAGAVPLAVRGRWCQDAAEIISNPKFLLPRRYLGCLSQRETWSLSDEDAEEVMSRLFMAGWAKVVHGQNGPAWAIRSEAHNHLAPTLMANTSAFIRDGDDQ